MAVTNKIETAVKRLLVRGKVVWFWPDEDYQTEFGSNSALTAVNTSETLTALISVLPGYVANPALAQASFNLPSVPQPDHLSIQVFGLHVELSNYTGGSQPGDSHFMVGGTPPGNNFNRATLQVSNPSQTYVLNCGSSNQLQTFSYQAEIDADSGATLTLNLDSVDGLAIYDPGGQLVQVTVNYLDFVDGYDNGTAPMCSKGQDYHDKDLAAFHVIARQGEETPPHSGNYLVHVRVECSANADDEATALALVEERLNQLRATLDVDDLPAQITAAAGGGLTVHPRSVWSRGVGEGVEGRKFSSAWEFVCVACEADL